MANIRFVSADGDETDLNIAPGISLMEGAVKGGIDGIDADCGGALSCATCHIYLDPDWVTRLAPPSDGEREMLEFAIDTNERSRLSCQIVVEPELEGMVVHIPASQA